MARKALLFSNAEEAKILNVLGERIAVLVGDSHDSGHEVVLHIGAEGAGPPPHFHPWDEDFYVVDGEIDFTVDGRDYTLARGGFVHIPAGTPHSFRHKTAQGRALGVNAPGGAIAFYTAIDGLGDGPLNMEKLFAIARECQVGYAGPPI